jgi:hypothetical protein
MQSWTAVLVLILVISSSLALRIKMYRRATDAPGTKPSLLSLAVGDLVATAGGVYLSLVMLLSFLKLDIPDKIPLFQCALDPLALLALTLAVIQPLVIRLFWGKGSR